jgi:hypothetical protein
VGSSFYLSVGLAKGEEERTGYIAHATKRYGRSIWARLCCSWYMLNINVMVSFYQFGFLVELANASIFMVSEPRGFKFETLLAQF